MSTGLTWLAIVDNSDVSQPYVDTMIQFADYNECYKYADWFYRAYSYTVGNPSGIKIFVYTTSPNVSGCFYWNSGVPGFLPFD